MNTEDLTTAEPARPSPASDLPERTPLPDIADLIFVLIIVLLTNLLPNYVLGDGSTGWHLATGHWILDHGAIPHTDLFSNTFPTKEWVPYEWLSDVVGALLENIGGIKLVAVATACGIAWLFSLVYLECRRGGCHFLLALILTILAVLTSTIHWLARPHIFTFFGVFLMARHLEKYRVGIDSRKRLLISVGVIMALWSNLHPAFLVGFALVIIYLCSEFGVWLFTASALRAASFVRLKTYAMALATGFLATFINPNAAKMYSYIFNYLRQSYVLQNTQEYMAGNLHDLHAICMLLILFLFVVALAGTRRAIGLAPLLTVLAFAYLGLNSMRNEPLFVIVATPIVGTLFGSFSLKRIFGRPFANAEWLNASLAKIHPTVENVDNVERTCTMHILPIATTLFLAFSCMFGFNGKLGPLEVITTDWDAQNKPTKTLDCIRELKLDWRNGLNLDNWGGYIYYKTKNRVFLDDRLDFYGSQFFLDYAHMIGLSPGYKDLMDKYNIKWILFPAKGPLVTFLRKSADWQLVCEDKGSAVLIRKPAQSTPPDNSGSKKSEVR